jgi:hypothetical protein
MGVTDVTKSYRHCNGEIWRMTSHVTDVTPSREKDGERNLGA